MSYKSGDGVWLRAHVVATEGDPSNEILILQVHGFFVKLSELSVNRDKQLLDDQTLKPGDIVQVDTRVNGQIPGRIEVDRKVRVLTESELEAMEGKGK